MNLNWYHVLQVVKTTCMFCKAMHNDSVNFIDYGWRNLQYKCPQYMPMRNIIPPTCCVVSILIPYRHIMVQRRESIDGNYHQSDSMFLYAIEPLYNKNILGKCSQKKLSREGKVWSVFYVFTIWSTHTICYCHTICNITTNIVSYKEVLLYFCFSYITSVCTSLFVICVISTCTSYHFIVIVTEHKNKANTN